MAKKIILAICFVVVFPLASIAAPLINNITGTFDHNNTVTISGSGFGLKTNATPYIWDNFEEDGAVGSYCSIHPNSISRGVWSNVGGAGADPNHYMKIDNGALRNSHSTKTSMHDYYAYTQNGSGADAFAINSTYSQDWYISYWEYHQADWNWSTMWGAGVLKFFRTFSRTDFVFDVLSGGIGFAFLNGGRVGRDHTLPDPSGQHWSNYNGSTYLANPSMDPSPARFTNTELNGTWWNVQIEIHQSTPNTYDGYYHIRFDNGVKTYDFPMNNLCTSATYSNTAIAQIGYFSNWVGTWQTNEHHKFYIDDIYVDTTQQRIEIGDNPTYSTCKHREVQLPSAWSDTSATVRVNHGSFADGVTAYLFVVDKNGTPSSGYQITIGGQGQATPPDSTPPASPSGVNVQIIQ